VILDKRYWKFHHTTEEEREDRTAAARKRLKGIGVRKRTVIRTRKLVHPIRIPMRGWRAKADRIPLTQIFFNQGKLLLESPPVAEQLVIMMDTVEADLAASTADVIKQIVRDVVVLGHKVPRRRDTVSPLNLKQSFDVLYSSWTLDIMGKDKAEAPVVWPKADEGQPVRIELHDPPAELVVLVIDECSLDRPSRKPVSSLERDIGAADCELHSAGKQGLDAVVQAAESRVAFAATVPLVQQVDGSLGR